MLVHPGWVGAQQGEPAVEFVLAGGTDLDEDPGRDGTLDGSD